MNLLRAYGKCAHSVKLAVRGNQRRVEFPAADLRKLQFIMANLDRGVEL